jgi:hypothetical protein
MTKKAADMLFQKTNYRPQDVDVVELHDCFSANELISYEALGLCAPGKAGELIDSGDNTYGGQYVINPSGGLISKGHPLGATGEYTYLLFFPSVRKCFSGTFSSVVHVHSIHGWSEKFSALTIGANTIGKIFFFFFRISVMELLIFLAVDIKGLSSLALKFNFVLVD